MHALHWTIARFEASKVEPALRRSAESEPELAAAARRRAKRLADADAAADHGRVLDERRQPRIHLSHAMLRCQRVAPGVVSCSDRGSYYTSIGSGQHIQD